VETAIGTVTGFKEWSEDAKLTVANLQEAKEGCRNLLSDPPSFDEILKKASCDLEYTRVATTEVARLGFGLSKLVGVTVKFVVWFQGELAFCLGI
jgi:hypothetical protein